MHKIIVRLPANRDYTGLLELQGPDGRRIGGPFPVCGRSDDRLAGSEGNIGRNPLLPYGDTPLGEYRLVHIVASGQGTPYGAGDYGTAGIVVLEPKHGEAALADANGRFSFFIHGGATERNGLLRPTDGSLRLSNGDQRTLIRLLRCAGSVACHCIAMAEERMKRSAAIAVGIARSGRGRSGLSAPWNAAPGLPLTSLSRRSWLRTAFLATGATVAIPSALVFTLQSAFGDDAGSGDYNAGNTPAPIVGQDENLKDAVGGNGGSGSSQTAAQEASKASQDGADANNTAAGIQQSDATVRPEVRTTPGEQASVEAGKVFTNADAGGNDLPSVVNSTSTASGLGRGTSAAQGGSPPNGNTAVPSNTNAAAPSDLDRQMQAIKAYTSSGSANPGPKLAPLAPPPSPTQSPPKATLPGLPVGAPASTPAQGNSSGN